MFRKDLLPPSSGFNQPKKGDLSVSEQYMMLQFGHCLQLWICTYVLQKWVNVCYCSGW